MKFKNRIGIDARMYGPIGKGLGRYTQELVDNILKLDNENEYIIFLSKDNFSKFNASRLNVKKVLADVRWYTFKEQIVMPFLIWRENIDLMHFPHFNVPILLPTKFIVTIHDLILTKFPTIRATKLSPFVYKIKHFAYTNVIKSAVKRSEKIITVSEFTKKDIVDKLNVKSEKISVVYEGIANQFKKSSRFSVDIEDDKNTLLKYNINREFLIYTGNAYPHKNLEWLVDNFKKKCKNFDLVLVGKDDFFYNRVKKIARKNKAVFDVKIIFPGYVSDYDLNVLYRNAFAYVFPSLYEGFGLPPLEAMSNGCPVISSNKASMPEILGNAVLYFDPKNFKNFIEKINLIQNNTQLRDELIKSGYQRVKKYSWKKCAKNTLNIYKCFLKK